MAKKSVTKSTTEKKSTTKKVTPKKKTVRKAAPKRSVKTPRKTKFRKQQVESSFVLKKWMRNAIALVISISFACLFYFIFIKPYAYRWMPCSGLKSYGVCMPYGYHVHGIDISRHQGIIDWPKLSIYREAEEPIQFIFMKATEGGDFKDVTFDQNLSKARNEGFICGAYHFFSPRSSARKQAQFFIQTVDLKRGDLPPVLDVEVAGKHSKNSLKDSVKVWLDAVERHYKVKPILYTSYKFKEKYLNDSVFNDYPFWIAHYYVGSVKYKGEWHFWQHTDIGEVPGIAKDVDLNVFNGTIEQLKAITMP